MSQKISVPILAFSGFATGLILNYLVINNFITGKNPEIMNFFIQYLTFILQFGIPTALGALGIGFGMRPVRTGRAFLLGGVGLVSASLAGYVARWVYPTLIRTTGLELNPYQMQLFIYAFVGLVSGLCLALVLIRRPVLLILAPTGALGWLVTFLVLQYSHRLLINTQFFLDLPRQIGYPLFRSVTYISANLAGVVLAIAYGLPVGFLGKEKSR
jgi:hypothetical protein